MSGRAKLRFLGRLGAALLLAFLLGLLTVPDRAAALDINWTNPLGGDFEDTSNWSPTVVPGASDVVIFDLPATYTVAVPNPVTNGQIVVRDGSPTLDLASNHTLTAPTGLLIGDTFGASPVLTLQTGELDLQQELIIAAVAGGSGSLTLQNGVFLDGGLFTQYVIGDAGTGTLVVVGAIFDPGFSSSSIVGRAPGSLGSVTLRGGGLWDPFGATSLLTIGEEGSGTFIVESGSSAISGSTTLGSMPGGSGTLLVQGTGSSFDAQSSPVWVGGAGTGAVSVLDGASMTAGAVAIASGSSLTVDGSTLDSMSLDVLGGGALSVLNGAVVTAALSPDPLASVLVSGPGSRLDAGASNVPLVAGLVIENDGKLLGQFSLGSGSYTLDNGAALEGRLSVIGGALTVQGGALLSGGPADVHRVSGTGAVTLANATWLAPTHVFFGQSATSVQSGGILSSGTASLSQTASVAVAPGGLWNAGALSIAPSASVSVDGDLSISGALDLQGSLDVPTGVVTAATLDLLAGSLTLGSGSTLTTGDLSYGGGSLILQGGTLVAPLVLVPAGTALSGHGALVGEVRTPRSASVTASGGDLTLGSSTSPLGVELGGVLDTGPYTLTLEDASFATLGVLTTVGGGILAAPNGIALGVGGNLVGAGAVQGRVAAALASTISASGNFTLGDLGALDGYFSDGVLAANHYTVTLEDRNAAVLGSLTTLGDAIGPGTLAAPNGLLLNPGRNLVGYGLVTADLTTNGSALGEGPAPTDGLEFTAGVTGAGDFAGNIVFSGTYSPGNSAALVRFENLALSDSAILEIELGGTQAGSDFDRVEVTGEAALAGILQVELIDGFVPAPGDLFEFLSATALRGSFGGFSAPTLGNGLRLALTSTSQSASLVVRPIPEPGTLALLGLGLLVVARLRAGHGRNASRA